MKSNISLCFPSVKTKETNKKKIIRQKTLSFTKLNQTFLNNKDFKKFKRSKFSHVIKVSLLNGVGGMDSMGSVNVWVECVLKI